MAKGFYILLIYFCHLQQVNGDILCINSQGHILNCLQLQNEELESVLFNLWRPDESQVYIQYQRLQNQFDDSSHIVRKQKLIYLKR